MTKVSLKKISIKDIPDFVAMHQDLTMYRYDPETEKVTTEEIARKYVKNSDRGWKKGKTFIFFIYNDSGDFVGFVTLRSVIKNSHCKLGFAIANEHRSQGYATAAITEVLHFAKNKLGIKVMEAAIHRENIPSQRCLHKNGFDRVPLTQARNSFKEREDYLIMQKNLN